MSNKNIYAESAFIKFSNFFACRRRIVYFSLKWVYQDASCRELEKNLRRFVGRFAYVRLWAIHEASDRLPVHVPQASSDPTLQLNLRSGLPATPVNFCLQESPKVLNRRVSHARLPVTTRIENGDADGIGRPPRSHNCSSATL